MKASKSDRYEEMLWYLIFLIGFGLIGLGLWTLTRLPLLPIIVLLFTAPLSYLISKNGHLFTAKFKMFPIAFGLLVISCICSGVILFGDKKSYAYYEKVFVKGRVHTENNFIEGDGEVVDHYEKRYYFEPDSNSSHSIIQILDWTLLVACLVFPYVNYKLIGKAVKIDELNKHV